MTELIQNKEDLIGLTESQQRHLDYVIKEHGYPPDGTTHFDTNYLSSGTWVKYEDHTENFWYWRKNSYWCFLGKYSIDESHIKIPKNYLK